MEDDAPPGVPEWVVTYGDMMSLLLTFFIMLVSMSEIVSNQKYRAVLESFQQRAGYQFSPSSAPGESFPLNSFIDRVKTMKLGSPSDESGVGGVRQPSTKGESTRVFTGPEGVGRRTGEVVRFDEEGRITSTSEALLLSDAVDLRGKPNKIEVRSWVTLEPADTRPARIRAAYDKARGVRTRLIESGVEGGRIRLAVLPVPGRGDLTSADLARNGAVTVAVLDAFEADFVGGVDGGG